MEKGTSMGQLHFFCICCFFYNTLALIYIDFRQVSSNDYNVIESKIKGIVKEKQPFERLVMTKENLLKMFEVCFKCLLFLYRCLVCEKAESTGVLLFT